MPDSDIHQNVSSDSATAENEKQQTICSQASVIVSESIFQEYETLETDVNNCECGKIYLVCTFPESMLEDTENTLENADNVTLSSTEQYLRCLISTFKRVVTMVEDMKESAKVGLQAVENQTEAESDILEDSNLIEHDPARRPAMLTRNQTKYLTISEHIKKN